MRTLIRIILVLLCVCPLKAFAQREVTPVETDDKKPAPPVLHYYDKHGDPLKTPVLFIEQIDTVQSVASAAKPIYPALHQLQIGVNFLDAVLVAAGQHHGGGDIWASLSMWNWLFPTVEIGLGAAKNTPSPGNFTYKGKPSPYFKIGADYNFLYKSNPDYRVMIGLRAAYSSFTFDVTDITVDSPYWQEVQHFSMNSLSSHAWWGEVLAGLRVNIWKNIALGWTFRYHFLFGSPDIPQASPWYIPGFGTRQSKISATFSLIYTLPSFRKSDAIKEPEVQ